MQFLLGRVAAFAALMVVACLVGGCTTTAVLIYAYDKYTEGDPAPCRKLNSVERALSPRCGAYEPGSLLTTDVAASGLPHCPLTLAARDPQFWPLLPELLARGAQPEACAQAPLAALAQARPCPDFAGASPQSLASLRWLAQADSRSVQHDVVRLLSCPNARAAGLDSVLDEWLVQGLLPSQGLAFSPLAALHPEHLASPFSLALQAHGHTARGALGPYVGRLASGFDEALRQGHLDAVGWWLDRVPELVNRVPSTQDNQLPWLPLARVITPNYLVRPEQQAALVELLIARGANPWRALPHDPAQSVVSYARQLKSPALAMLDSAPPAATRMAGAQTVSAAVVP